MQTRYAYQFLAGIVSGDYMHSWMAYTMMFSVHASDAGAGGPGGCGEAGAAEGGGPHQQVR